MGHWPVGGTRHSPWPQTCTTANCTPLRTYRVGRTAGFNAPLGLDLSRSAASRRLQPRRPGLPPGAPGYRRRLPGTGRAGAGPLLTSAGARAHDEGDYDVAVYAPSNSGGVYLLSRFVSFNFMGSRPPPRAGILFVLSFVPRTGTCSRHLPVRADPWLPSRPASVPALRYRAGSFPPEVRPL